MKHFLGGLGCGLMMLVLACSGTDQPEGPTVGDPPPDEVSPTPAGTPVALLETDRGTITIQLLPEVAPQTVENFIRLAQSGFYKRTTFHRVMAGMMIQGGDPNSADNDPYNDGQGNSGKFLPAEFSPEPFTRGAVAMARQEGDPDSASSQFFIVLQRSPQWDGEYTIFGKVLEGIAVADEISQAPLAQEPQLKNRNHPMAKIFIRDVTIEYR